MTSHSTSTRVVHPEHVEAIAWRHLDPGERTGLEYLAATYPDSIRLARYRGRVIDLHDIDGTITPDRIPTHQTFPDQWHGAGYASDTFYSGVLIHWHQHCPQHGDDHTHEPDQWTCATVATYLT